MFRYDESDPRFLIVYTGDDHAMPADYLDLMHHWVAGLDRKIPFGVIIVAEPHEHHDDEDDPRQYEAEITRIINDFRRDYRDRTMLLNTGYVRVFTPEMVQAFFPTPEVWQQAEEANDRFARYNWGIPGGGFTSLEEAKAWLLKQEQNQPASEAATETPSNTGRIGLFYGSSTGATEYIAEEIQAVWEAAGMQPIEAINITGLKDLSALLEYDGLILGSPTWNIGQLQDDWDILFPSLDTLDFTGKKVAIFGVGDARGYPDNFLDAIGILGEKLIERGATLTGYYTDEHYQFKSSLAWDNNAFMGLGIDEVSQSRLTADRVERWVAQLIREFAVQPVSAES